MVKKYATIKVIIRIIDMVLSNINMDKRIILLGLFFFLGIWVFCQDNYPGINTLSIKEGLSSNKINDVVRDSSGFLWIGTYDGINRYDGQEVKKYFITSYTVNKKHNNINCIYKDSKERLWAGTSNKGLLLYNPQMDTWNSITQPDDNTSLINPLVSTVYEDCKGNIWVGHYDGISMYNETSGSFATTEVSFKGEPAWIQAIQEDAFGKIWLGTYNCGLYRFHPASGKLDHFIKPFENLNGNALPRIYDICSLDDDEIYVGCWKGGLFKISFPDDQPVFQKLENEFTNEIFALKPQKKSNSVWIGSEKGVSVFNPDKNEFVNEKINIKKYDAKSVHALYFDNEDNLFIGTGDGGMLFVPDKENIFSYIQSSLDEKNYYIRDIIEMPEGFVKIRTTENSYYFKRLDQNWQLININEAKALDLHLCPEILNPELLTKDKAEHCRSIMKNKLHDKEIEMLSITKTYFLFLSSDNRLFACHLKNNKCLTINNIIPGKDIVVNNLVKVEGDTIYAVINNYLTVFLLNADGKTKIIKQYKTLLPGGKTEFYDNVIYFGTYNGFFIYDYPADKLQRFSAENGLPSNIIKDIELDVKGRPWLTTENGLAWYNPDQEIIHLINMEKFGIKNKAVAVLDRFNTGELFMGGNNILVSFMPDTLVSNISDQPFPLIFTSYHEAGKLISPGERKYYPSHLSFIDHIKIPYKVPNFSFQFTNPSMAGASKGQYSYKLEGNSDEWINLGTNNEVFFAGLPPGGYQLMIRYNKAKENTKPLSLSIHIVPPFYKTTFFKLLIISLTFFLIIGFYYIRLRVLTKQKAFLEKEVSERTAQLIKQNEEMENQAENLKEINAILNERNEEIELQASELMKANATKDRLFGIIAHDLRNPFQGIISFSDILLEKFKEVKDNQKLKFIELINFSSKSAYSLLENLLEWSRSQTGTIKYKPETFNIIEVVDETFHVMGVNAKKKDVRLINNMSQSHKVFADKNMITTVIRNLVNNAIKFTEEGGKIEVNAISDDNQATINVIDTGVGIPANKIDKLFKVESQYSTQGTSGEEGTGLGLMICKEFVTSNKGGISVSSNPGQGTCFSISLPINKNSKVTPGHAAEQPGLSSLQEKEEKNQEVASVTKEKKIYLDKSEATNSKPILLIVDDNESIRIQVKTQLSDFYIFVVARNGEEGFDIAKEIIPDLVISDIMMPVMDGIKLCHSLKNDELTSHVPVILLTAKAGKNSQIEGLITGADDYVTKPFSSDLLKARIDNLLLSRKKLKEKFSKNIKLGPKEVELSTHDEALFNKMVFIMEENISNEDFGVIEFSEKIGMSRTQLFRKIKGLTGQTPSEFLKKFRMKKAAQLIKSNNMSVSEVMYAVGFDSTSYFAKCFKESFGVLPSDYI
jgi:signal transduction histidine kinase/DNA-binding response OmpR family regulator/ligand-binding sensor domain-containing protein